MYAVTKRDHEELFLTVGAAYGIPTVALRYFNVYGPRQALSNPYTGVMAIFSARLLNGRAPLIFEDGLQSRDFVHVSDIVQANLLALEQRRRGRSRLQRRDRARDDDPARRRGAGAPARRARSRRSCRAASAPATCATASPTSRAIRDELGYEPRVRLEAGMKELLEWLRTQAAEDRVDEAHPRARAARGASRDEGRRAPRRAPARRGWSPRFERLRLLVVGDAMLDEYLWGDVERVSPEAPVPVVHVQRESMALGGAGNVRAQRHRDGRARPMSRDGDRRRPRRRPRWSTC